MKVEPGAPPSTRLAQVSKCGSFNVMYTRRGMTLSIITTTPSYNCLWVMCGVGEGGHKPVVKRDQPECSGFWQFMALILHLLDGTARIANNNNNSNKILFGISSRRHVMLVVMNQLWQKEIIKHISSKFYGRQQGCWRTTGPLLP